MLPFMRYKNSINKYDITSFGGINHTYSQRINEFDDALNMSSKDYPAVSSHGGMVPFFTPQNTLCTADFAEKLYTIEKTSSIPGEMYICSPNSRTKLADIADEEQAAKLRTMAFMKDSVFVVPDNVICNTNTMQTKDAGINQQITKDSEQARFEAQSETSGSMPLKYGTWYSGELSSNGIKAFSASYKVSGTSYQFYSMAISDKFEAGDVVTLKLEVKVIDEQESAELRAYRKKLSDGITLKIKELTTTKHSTPSGTKSEYTSIIFEDDSIDTGGYADIVVLNMIIEKGVPNFVDICSFENRMWGVTTSEICASKLGDCSEWNDFTADRYGTLPSSCFKTQVESVGSFTAICAFNGNILAFKEDCIHKIYGNEPAEFRVARTDCPGVEKDASKTLAVVGRYLYYKGKEGIYAYNGSTVNPVSRAFDTSSYKADIAAGDDRFYCIHLFNESESIIAVFDSLYGIWHKTSCKANLKSLVRTDNGIVAAFEDSVMNFGAGKCDKWHFSLSFGKREFASMHISSVFARCSLADDAKAKISIKNRNGTYVLKNLEGSHKNSPVMLTIPVSCARDATLLFEGEGDFTLSSLTVRYKKTGIND